jgi:hypothetical protein
VLNAKTRIISPLLMLEYHRIIMQCSGEMQEAGERLWVRKPIAGYGNAPAFEAIYRGL